MMHARGLVCLFVFLFGGRLQAEVLNGGFERLAESQLPVAWTPLPDSARVAIARDRAHGGKISVVLSGYPACVIGDAVGVQSGAVYVLTGWARVDSGRAFARIRWLADDRTEVDESSATTEVKSASWTQWAGVFVAPPKAAFARVMCFANGEAAFDDVRLNQISAAMPTGLQLETTDFPLRGGRVARVRATLKDSVVMHAQAAGRDSLGYDGAAVIFEASRGQIAPWAKIKNGIATATLRDTAEKVGGVWVRARFAHLIARAYVGDQNAARLRGRLFDADTERPLAARVIVADSLGTVLQTGFGGERGFVADGAFAIDVPPGKVTVSARRDFTHLPPEPRVLHLVRGEERLVLLPFDPWTDLRARGWVSGDFFCGTPTAARARGLDWAVLPARVNGGLIPILRGKSIENQWGKYRVLGAAGIPDAERPGFEVHARARSDRGIVEYADPFGASGNASLAFDVLAGPAFDAFDIAHPQARATWFALLNRGYRIAGTAFSTAGHFRTYTQVLDNPTPSKLTHAIANGQNAITNGPLVSFSVFAAGPGAQLPAGRKRRATIRAWSAADAAAHLTRIDLIRNAEVIQSWDLDDHPRQIRVSTALEDAVDCWYLARCYGADTSRVALTNPIFFETENFAPPQPVQAVVRGTIATADSTSAPRAIVKVLDPTGRMVLETETRDHTFQIWVPATSRIRVEAEGYEAASQRIFDHPDIQRILREPIDLPDLTILDKLTEQLQALEMVFMLKRQRSEE